MKRISLWFSICLLLTGSGYAQQVSELLTVGIAVDDPTFSRHLDRFKVGMTRLGHIEDETVRYTFYGFIDEQGGIENSRVEQVASDHPDIIFVLGNHSALWAQKAIAGTDIPAVFSMISSDPVREGIVESLSRPEANMTGIRVPDSVPKALEWLVTAVPGIKKISLPYDPGDEISVLAMNGLDDAAARLGVALVPLEAGSVEEAVAAIETLPEDIDAIFRVPSRTFEVMSIELSRAAIRRNLPVGSANSLEEEVLVTFSPDFAKAGRRAAWLVNKILQGANPADLPVETSDVYLTIDLKVAEKLGIHVPDSVLVNANIIIR